ncbi:MAG: SDR family oxidoreductase [Acidimicrobiales bacterium]
MTEALPLRGTSALITGGGSGIGLGAAAALVADGMSVTLMGRNEEKLTAAADGLRASAPEGVVVNAYAGDVTDEDAVIAAVALAASVNGGLDACVAAAGDGTLGPVIATSLDEWNRVLGVSLTGVFLTFKHAGALMARSGGGSMVAVSSVASLVTHRFMAPYCVAKAGVDMLVRTTADELGGVGVRVNSVNPSIVRTDLVAMIEPDDTVGQSYLAGMPISRFGEVADVAPAIRFLCGPESSHITAVNLPIDGGHHLRTGPDYYELTSALYGSAADGIVD